MVLPQSTDEFARINQERLERDRRLQREREEAAQRERDRIERERANSSSTTPGENPRAEQRRLAERRAQEREEFIERETRLSDAARARREELSDRAFRERLRGNQTDLAAGIQAISREEFDRIANSKFTKSEQLRTEKFLRDREKRIQREYLENLRENLRQLDISIKRAELNRLNDELETLNNRSRGIAREGLSIAGDLGLSMIPVYGTFRDAKRTAKNWDTLSTQERALDVGLLSLSAIGDATFIFGVGAGIKTAVAGARGTSRVVSTTATLTRADDVANFVRLADRARNPIRAIEVASAPDAKFISQVGKVAEQFPTKKFDILVEPTQKSIASAKKIQDVIEQAAPTTRAGRFTTPSNVQFVVELDKALPSKKVKEIVDGLGKGAPGKPRNVTVRIVDRGLNNSTANDVAEAIADARRAFSSGKNIDSLASQKIVTEGNNKTSPALRDAILRARKLQAQKKTRSESQIKAELTKEAKSELDDLAGDTKKLNSSGKDLAARLRRNDFNVKVEELKFNPVSNVKGIERNVRFEPEPPKPIRQGGSAGRGSGDNRAVALLERTSLKGEAKTAPRITGRSGTRTATTRKTPVKAGGAPVPQPAGDDEAQRKPTSTPGPAPSRAGSPAPDDAPDPTPNILELPQPGPQPDPEPQPDPDPDNVPDPTKSDTDTPTIKRGGGNKGKRVPVIKLAPQLVDEDGNKLFPVKFNYKLGSVYKTANLITGKQTTSRRIPKGGVEGGVTPQETLKAVGFSERTPSRKRFKLTDTVDAVVSADKRIRFKGKRRTLNA